MDRRKFLESLSIITAGLMVGIEATSYIKQTEGEAVSSIVDQCIIPDWSNVEPTNIEPKQALAEIFNKMYQGNADYEYRHRTSDIVFVMPRWYWDAYADYLIPMLMVM